MKTLHEEAIEKAERIVRDRGGSLTWEEVEALITPQLCDTCGESERSGMCDGCGAQAVMEIAWEEGYEQGKKAAREQRKVPTIDVSAVAR